MRAGPLCYAAHNLKVIFPFRIVSKPPYEVSETGWGEFEIQIRIYFNDLTEKPVTLYHGLKLFHTNEAVTSQAMIQVF